VDKLTRVLAGRLAAIVPDGFHVEAADGMLWHSAGGGRFPGQTGDYQVGRGGTCVRVHVEGGGQATGDALAGSRRLHWTSFRTTPVKPPTIPGPPGTAPRRGRTPGCAR